MTLTKRFNELSTDELVEYFKTVSLQDHPPKELIEELAKRPGIVFIQATDSAETTMEKALAAIHQIENSSP